MPRLLLALAVAGLLVLPTSLAYADDQPDPCVGYAARAAYPSLQYSYQFSPQGYGPWGFAPLTYPFGAGPYGNAAFFGVPGPGGMLPLSPSFGPLGPGGITSNVLANQVLQPGGFSITNPANLGNTIALLGLQQAELGTLNTRYSNSAYYQTAAATWNSAYATQAASAFTIYQALCQSANAGTAPTTTSTMMAPSMPMSSGGAMMPMGYGGGMMPAAPAMPMMGGY
jgi:hypothetical protein